MQAHSALEVSSSAPAALVPSLLRFANRLYAAISKYYVARLNAHAAAVMYEQLSRLSDTELACRGMTRSDLRRHVFERLTMRL